MMPSKLASQPATRLFRLHYTGQVGTGNMKTRLANIDEEPLVSPTTLSVSDSEGFLVSADTVMDGERRYASDVTLKSMPKVDYMKSPGPMPDGISKREDSVEKSTVGSMDLLCSDNGNFKRYPRRKSVGATPDTFTADLMDSLTKYSCVQKAIPDVEKMKRNEISMRKWRRTESVRSPTDNRQSESLTVNVKGNENTFLLDRNCAMSCPDEDEGNLALLHVKHDNVDLERNPERGHKVNASVGNRDLSKNKPLLNRRRKSMSAVPDNTSTFVGVKSAPRRASVSYSMIGRGSTPDTVSINVEKTFSEKLFSKNLEKLNTLLEERTSIIDVIGSGWPTRDSDGNATIDLHDTLSLNNERTQSSHVNPSAAVLSHWTSTSPFIDGKTNGAAKCLIPSPNHAKKAVKNNSTSDCRRIQSSCPPPIGVKSKRYLTAMDISGMNRWGNTRGYTPHGVVDIPASERLFSPATRRQSVPPSAFGNGHLSFSTSCGLMPVKKPRGVPNNCAERAKERRTVTTQLRNLFCSNMSIARRLECDALKGRSSADSH